MRLTLSYLSVVAGIGVSSTSVSLWSTFGQAWAYYHMNQVPKRKEKKEVDVSEASDESDFDLFDEDMVKRALKSIQKKANTPSKSKSSITNTPATTKNTLIYH